MKFDIKKDNKNEAFWLYKKYDNELFKFGNNDIVIYKKDLKSFCKDYNSSFDYKGIKNALIGKTGNAFYPKRILVIQMK